MTSRPTTVDVRPAGASASSIEIAGDVTSASERLLLDAYERATADGSMAIILDLGRLAYMNSGGIGLLVTLLVRARSRGQRLMAVGLSDHYREILAVTRLDEAIGVHATLAEAIEATRA